eukprot:GILI01001143.1.p1 GENE.GILI01001143.1~~GILI01001143.1.p1  ORF type:complete len:753 (+),score=218.18 GILI01001143.1:205-2463(+)
MSGQLGLVLDAMNASGALSTLSPRSPGSARGRRSKKFTALSDKFKKTGSLTSARDNEQELSAIRSVEELMIDYRRALSIKRGDLAIIQGEVFKCTPAAPNLRDIPLILKRLDCVDRRTYDLKVYEADTFMRFRGHSNIVSLYSYWSEKPSSPYTYKTLVLLLEEGILGDMLRTVVLNPVRPSNRVCMRYLCDVAKGLIAIHNCNIIHGGVKPSGIYLSANNTAMVGEFRKVELDSARQTHQLFSKLLIGEAIPHTLVYWAPELLKLDKYGKQADMWALGVTFYQIITGEHPFNVEDENRFREDALSANVDWSRLEEFPRMRTIVENLLRVSPEKRWTAHHVLAFAQYDFAVDLQRCWRGYSARKDYQRVRRALIMVQSHIKGLLQKLRYQRERIIRRETAATRLQSKWRGHHQYDDFTRQKLVLMRCQAHVLARQNHRAYLKMKDDVVMAQCLIRRCLAMRWFSKIHSMKNNLESTLASISSQISKYNAEAVDFQHQFLCQKIAGPYRHLQSFEDYELAHTNAGGGKAKLGGDEAVHLPRLQIIYKELEDLRKQNKELTSQLSDREKSMREQKEEDEHLRSVLGEKYTEFQPMVEALKKSLKRVADACQRAQFLPVKIQHPYTYSKWDSVHEPYNVVENVLSDDEQVYRALSPSIDLTLLNNQACFVASVEIHPGECGPANVEIYTSNTPEKWTLVKELKCGRDAFTSVMLPGEQICKYLRVKCLNNVRGGNIVSVRQVRVKGLPKDGPGAM